MSNLNNKIKNIKELHKGDFISLYDLEYKNKLNQDKHWSVATRKDKEALEEFYLKNKEDKQHQLCLLYFLNKTLLKLLYLF